MNLPFDPAKLKDLMASDREAIENLEAIHGHDVAIIIGELGNLTNFAMVLKEIFPPFSEPVINSIAQILAAVASLSKKDVIALSKDVKAAAGRRRL